MTMQLINRDSTGVVSSFVYNFDGSNRITSEIAYQQGVRTALRRLS